MTPHGLRHLLASPIAFHRIFAAVAGGALPGLFLSQVYYWSSRTADEEGWFYKSGKEWEAETGMTRREQETAREALKARGIIEERQTSINGVRSVLYRLDMDLLTEVVETIISEDSDNHDAMPARGRNVRNAHFEKSENAISKSTKRTSGNVRNAHFEKDETYISNGTKAPFPIDTEITSEITSETTTENSGEACANAHDDEWQCLDVSIVSEKIKPGTRKVSDIPSSELVKASQLLALFLELYKTEYGDYPLSLNRAAFGGHLNRFSNADTVPFVADRIRDCLDPQHQGAVKYAQAGHAGNFFVSVYDEIKHTHAGRIAANVRNPRQLTNTNTPRTSGTPSNAPVGSLADLAEQNRRRRLAIQQNPQGELLNV